MISLIISLAVVSCQTSEDTCEPGYSLAKHHVNESIRTLEPIAQKRLLFSGEAYRAVFFLNSLTGIGGQVEYGDVSYYEKSKFREDKANWLGWLEANHCTIADSTVLSLRKEIENETPWVGSSR